jgi:hypothetical protein
LPVPRSIPISLEKSEFDERLNAIWILCTAFG